MALGQIRGLLIVLGTAAAIASSAQSSAAATTVKYDADKKTINVTAAAGVANAISVYWLRGEGYRIRDVDDVPPVGRCKRKGDKKTVVCPAAATLIGINTGDRDDTVDAPGARAVVVTLGSGNDSMHDWTVGSWHQGSWIDGGDGNDFISADPVYPYADNDDLIVGGNGNDILEGSGGNDRIIAGNGIDHINGGPGDDQLLENGTVNNGGQFSTIDGDEGNDTMTSVAENTYFADRGGSDTIRGGSASDYVDLARDYVYDDVDCGPGGVDVALNRERFFKPWPEWQGDSFNNCEIVKVVTPSDPEY